MLNLAFVPESVLVSDVQSLYDLTASTIVERLSENWPFFRDVHSRPPSRDLETGVLSLQTFIYSNWYEFDCGGGGGDVMYEPILIDNEPCRVNLKYGHLLQVARSIFEECEPSRMQKWWLLRVCVVCSSLIDEPTPRLVEIAQSAYEEAADVHPMFSMELYSALVALKMYREASDVLETRLSPSSETLVTLKGLLGKRTKFQHTEIAQLIAECRSDDKRRIEWPESPACEMFSAVADEVSFSTPCFSERRPDQSLSTFEQCLILNVVNQERLHGVRGSPDVDREHLMAYLDALDSNKGPFEVRRAVAWERCRIEARQCMEKPRLLERCLVQLESLNSGKLPECSAVWFHYVLAYRVPVPLEIRLFHANLCKEVGLYREASLAFNVLRTECGMSGQVLIDEIEALRSSGRSQDARVLIEQNLSNSEQQPHNRWELKRALGELTNDVGLLESAFVDSGRKDAQCQRTIGKLHFDANRYSDAINAFQKSLALNPAQSQALSLLALSAMRAEQWSVAIAALEKSCSRNPDRYDQWANMALCAIKLGQKERAQRLTKNEAIRLAYDNWRLWENLLTLSVDIGQWTDAILAYRRLTELKPRFSDPELLQAISNGLRTANEHRRTSDWKQLLGSVALGVNLDYRVLEVCSDWATDDGQRREQIHRSLAILLKSQIADGDSWAKELCRLAEKAIVRSAKSVSDSQRLKLKLDLAVALAQKYELAQSSIQNLRSVREKL